MFLKLSLISVFLFCFTSKVHALIFIEPMVGYATGSTEFSYTSPADPTANDSDKPDIKGLNCGLKGGVELGGMQLGLEYMKNSLKKSGADKSFYTDDDGSTYNSDFRATEMAALVGYRFLFLRVYGGYIFDAKVNKKDLGDIDFKKGTGTKFGATFYAFSNLAISLEYRTVSFDKITTDDAVLEVDYNTTALLVSFPFGI